MKLNFCEAGGFLVRGNGELPDDASEYQAEMRRPVIGCNQVTCTPCGAAVKSKPGLFPLVVDGPRDWTTIYETDDWSTVPGMDRDPAYRLYVCACRFDAVRGSRPLRRDDTSATPWSCAGHLPAMFPVTIDGIEITRFTDLERVVKEHLDRPFILGLLYERLAGTPLEDELGEIASRLLSDPNPRARAMALALYWANPGARGARRVVDLARGDRSGFMDVPDPVPISGLDLEGRLLRTLAKLWADGVVSDEDALEPLRRSASRRQTSRAVISVLFERDCQWLKDHATEIAEAAPNAMGLLLGHLGVALGESELIALAKRATGLSADERAIVCNDIMVHVAGPLQESLLANLAE
ncbi:hypothetical protein BH09MYX1_BH09MYX1_58160 [soil metagenome]